MRRGGILFGHDQGHADAAIEHAVHFGFGDAAMLLQPFEQRRHGPGGLLQHGAHALGQRARDVLDQAAAGDMRQALDLDLLHQREQRLDVDARRLQQHLGQRPAVEIRLQVGLRALDDGADQRIAVGVRAAGCQPQHRVAGRDRPCRR